MKRMLKAVIILLILAVSANLLVSCADTSYIATVNGNKVNSDEYAFLMYFNVIGLMQTYTDTDKLNVYLDSVDTKQDPSETRKVYEVQNAFVKDYFELRNVSKNKFRELGLTEDPSLKENIMTSYQNFKSKIGGENVVSQIIGDLKITETRFRDLFYEYLLINYDNDLIKYYFGETGEKKITDDEFYNTYINIKYIEIKAPTVSFDTTGKVKEFTAEQNRLDAEAKAKADSLLAEIKAGKKDFITQMKDATVNTDSGLAKNPDGYFFRRATEDERAKNNALPKAYEDAIFALKVGDLSVIRGIYGYQIMRRDDSKALIPQYKEKYLTRMPRVITEYTAMTEEWKSQTVFVYNKETLKKYDIKSIKPIKITPKPTSVITYVTPTPKK